MANLYFYNLVGNKVSISVNKLKTYAGLGIIKPDTIIENEQGQKIPALELTSKIKGLKFRERAHPQTVSPDEPEVLTASSEQKTATTWFYYDCKGRKQGPVSGGQLKGLVKAGVIMPGTTVETENGKIAPAVKVKGLTFVEAVQPQTPPQQPPTTQSPFTAEEQAEIDQFLAKYGTDVKNVIKYGHTLLHLAVREQRLSVVKYLVLQGADVNVKGGSGTTPLMLAASEKIEVVNFLVSKGADVNGKNDLGTTPIDIAAWSGNIEIVKRLVSVGADIHVKTNRGQTPLDSARQGANVNAARQRAAARDGCIKVVQYLFSIGATETGTQRELGDPSINNAIAQLKNTMDRLVETTGGKRAQETMNMLRQSATNLPVYPVKTSVPMFLGLGLMLAPVVVTGWLWAITHPELPQIRACGHYRTRLLKILLCYVLFIHFIFH